jgi:hypothetical protein
MTDARPSDITNFINCKKNLFFKISDIYKKHRLHTHIHRVHIQPHIHNHKYIHIMSAFRTRKTVNRPVNLSLRVPAQMG